MSACTRCQTPLEHGDLRCAVCAFVREADEVAEVEVVRVSIVRCTECGAAVAFVAEIGAPRCAFCGAVTKIEQPIDPIERAELTIPARVEKEVAAAALKGWLGRRGWFAPGDLASTAALDTMQLLHWSGWVVDAQALVSWAADSDLGSQSSAWAPHSGQVSMQFAGTVVPASRGLTWAECATLTPAYDLASATPIVEDAPPPGTVEAFDAQRSAARKTVLAAIEATAAGRLQREGSIPGTRFRNVRVGVMLQSLSTRRVVLPVWILAYRYRGHPYRALVHGQQPGVVTGESPTSMWKVLLVIGFVLLIAAAIFGGAR